MDAFYDFVIDIEIRRFGIQQLDKWNDNCAAYEFAISRVVGQGITL